MLVPAPKPKHQSLQCSCQFNNAAVLHPILELAAIHPAMAAITSVMAASAAPRSTIFMPTGARGSLSAPVLGLPCMKAHGGRARCSMEGKRASCVAPLVSVLAALSAAGTPNPVLALVDERLSTEGTGLSLGLSNNHLGWILLGVFGLIWSFYTVYTSTLEEDDDSGLSL